MLLWLTLASMAAMKLAVEHVRRMRGGAQVQLMRCDDEAYYIVKFQNNPQHLRILANEMLATRLAARLGLCSGEHVRWASRSTLQRLEREPQGRERRAELMRSEREEVVSNVHFLLGRGSRGALALDQLLTRCLAGDRSESQQGR